MRYNLEGLTKELKRQGIILTPASKWTNDEPLVRTIYERGNFFPSHMLYANKEGARRWGKLEEGTGRYNHSKDQLDLISEKCLQKKVKGIVDGHVPFIIGGGEQASSEIEILLNSGLNLEVIFNLDSSLLNLVSSSVNIRKKIYQKTGKLPIIYSYHRLIQELPGLMPEIRNKIDRKSNLTFLTFGIINDRINVVSPDDCETLVSLSHLMDSRDNAIYTTHEVKSFDKFTTGDTKGKYDTPEFWDFVTQVPEKRFGIQTEGKDVRRIWFLDDKIGASVHAIVRRESCDEPFCLYISDKMTHDMMKERIRTASLEGLFHGKSKNSMASLWVLQTLDPLLNDQEKRGLFEMCRENIKENPERYGLQRGESSDFAQLKFSGLEILINDLKKKLIKENRPGSKSKGLTREEKYLRALSDTSAIVRNPEAPIRDLEKDLRGISVTGYHSQIPLQFILELTGDKDRRIVHELKKLPNKYNGNVLIVDDDKERFVIPMTIGLKRLGFNVGYVINGEECLRIIKNLTSSESSNLPLAETIEGNFTEGIKTTERKVESLDAILLDLDMPGKNGFDVLRESKGMNCKIPIVVVTGHASTENTAEAMRLGAKDVTIKTGSCEDIGYKLMKAIRDK